MSLGTPLESFPRTRMSTAIRTSLSLLVLGAMTWDNRAYAQDTGDADDDEAAEEAVLEEVVVTGFAGSLRSAQAIKENSDVLIDSITAEDIGALPDNSVTEALQRIPGVSINRFAAGRDPDHFSVEGAGVVVRGLTYVKSEINGRESFTANNGRGLSFADIPAELLIGVDVVKSLTADRLEGGIAGTVNLRTRKPFDSQENILAFGAEATYSDFIEETTPSVNVLGSYLWSTDAGDFGILGSLVYSQIKSRADKVQISNFANRTLYSSGDVVDYGNGETPVGQVYFPRGAVAGSQEFDRERYGYAASMQWRSPDETMEATAEFLRSDAREAWTERTVEIATDNVSAGGADGTCANDPNGICDSRAVPGTTIEFDDSDIFDNGYITGPTGWRDDQWSGNPRTPTYGLQSNNIARAVDQKFVTDDYSLNLKWFVTDDWALSFDYQHVDSTVENLDAGIWASTFQNARIDMNGNSIPNVEFTPPILCTDAPSNTCATYFTGEHASFADPYNSFWRSAMDHIEDSDGDLDSYRIDASRVIDNSDWMDGIQFGYRYADRDQTARFSTYNWGALSEIWGAGGPVWLDNPVSSQGAGFEQYAFPDFMNGETASPIGADGRLFYAGDITGNYADYVAFANMIANTWNPAGAQDTWESLADRVGVVAGTPFLPNEINPVREKNHAAYISMKFSFELGNGSELLGNAGVRYTETNRKATGFEVFAFQEYTSEEACLAPLEPGQSRSTFCSLPAEVRQDARDYSNGAMLPTTYDLDYDFWLPSLNLLWRLREGLQFRASYFQGVAPPDFGLTRAYFPINLQTNAEDIEAGGGRPVGRFNAGNPDLLPVESDNYDVTAEWYFADLGQLTFAVFYKELDNIRTNDIQRRTFTNNGATFDGIVTTAVNSPETGKIKGFEVAYQQQYKFWDGWLGGFGLNANYTYVDSSNVPQSTLSETDPDVAADNQSTVDTGLLPLEGLSEHTVNLQPFYEYGKWSARLAYAWRSEFLLTVRDVIVPFQPIMHEETGQLDASLFYQINDSLRIGLQGVNLTQEVLKTSAVLTDELLEAPRSWYLNDRRYSLVLRGSF
ncbi:MAG: TonB-dependent receptor [Lysobacterales bacterium]